MNLRIYKKKAKRARQILQARYGFRDDEFYITRCREDVTLDDFSGLDKGIAGRGFFAPLKGTPTAISGCYWTNDTDVQCCLWVLSECQFWDVSERTLNRRWEQQK
ncbi:MAG: hypothetical protein AAF468_12460 [Pseudomonadota bacterium]